MRIWNQSILLGICGQIFSRSHSSVNDEAILIDDDDFTKKLNDHLTGSEKKKERSHSRGKKSHREKSQERKSSSKEKSKRKSSNVFNDHEIKYSKYKPKSIFLLHRVIHFMKTDQCQYSTRYQIEKKYENMELVHFTGNLRLDFLSFTFEC